jgi:uncharacterized membrane protein YbhN (UPF0104 family)
VNSPTARRPLTWTLLRALVGVLILVLLISTLDLNTIVTKAAAANLWLVLFSVTGLTLDHAVAGFAWREIARFIRAGHMSIKTAVASYYVAQAFGGLTPGNLGGDAYRVYALRRAGQSWTSSALPVLIQRATSFLALAALGAAGVALLPSASGIGTPLLVTGAALSLGLAVPIVLLLRRRSDPLAALRALEDVREDKRGKGLPPALAVGFALGLVFHAVGILLAFALVMAVAPGTGSLAVLGAVAVARLTIAIPLSPSGIGFQEGALAVLFVGIGLQAETALAASLLGRLSLLSTTAVGVGVMFSRGRRGTHLDGPHPRSADATSP